ncbi:retinitis pigmentosa GTPase regulator b isoform X1 [Labrus bergylta]|uniref:retinitis pigmentosa GTPase regulator b isoform X1 n=1 Tax=Labrus bergylta TaxID=56723 RepID=UPI0033137131
MFGSNNWGQLGLGSKVTVNKPTCVKALKSEKVQFVACGRNHTLICTAQGKVFSSGGNSEGQLGLGDCEERTAFQRIHFFDSRGPIKMLAAGSNTSAALTESGKLFMWGDNTEGQIGLGKESHAASPQEVSVGQPISWVSCGYYHSALVTADGALYTFGERDSGKLGLGTEQLPRHRVPQRVKSIKEEVLQVACGGGHTVALTEDDIYTFGLGQFGQLGHGTFIFESRVPRLVEHFRKGRVCQVNCGENHTAVITESGLLYSFGDGRHGKLGLGEENFTNQFKPTLCPRFLKYNVQAATCGGCHMVVLACPRDPGCSDVTLEEDDVTEDYLEKPYVELLGSTADSSILQRSLSARVRRRERERSPDQFGAMFRTLPAVMSGYLRPPLPISGQTIPPRLPPTELSHRKVLNGTHQHGSAGSMHQEQTGDVVESLTDTDSVKDLGETTDFLNMTHVMKMDPGDKSLTLSPVQKRKGKHAKTNQKKEGKLSKLSSFSSTPSSHKSETVSPRRALPTELLRGPVARSSAPQTPQGQKASKQNKENLILAVEDLQRKPGKNKHPSIQDIKKAASKRRSKPTQGGNQLMEVGRKSGHDSKQHPEIRKTVSAESTVKVKQSQPRHVTVKSKPIAVQSQHTQASSSGKHSHTDSESLDSSRLLSQGKSSSKSKENTEISKKSKNEKNKKEAKSKKESKPAEGKTKEASNLNLLAGAASLAAGAVLMHEVMSQNSPSPSESSHSVLKDGVKTFHSEESESSADDFRNKSAVSINIIPAAESPEDGTSRRETSPDESEEKTDSVTVQQEEEEEEEEEEQRTSADVSEEEEDVSHSVEKVTEEEEEEEKDSDTLKAEEESGSDAGSSVTDKDVSSDEEEEKEEEEEESETAGNENEDETEGKDSTGSDVEEEEEEEGSDEGSSEDSDSKGGESESEEEEEEDLESEDEEEEGESESLKTSESKKSDEGSETEAEEEEEERESSAEEEEEEKESSSAEEEEEEKESSSAEEEEEEEEEEEKESSAAEEEEKESSAAEEEEEEKGSSSAEEEEEEEEKESSSAEEEEEEEEEEEQESSAEEEEEEEKESGDAEEEESSEQEESEHETESEGEEEEEDEEEQKSDDEEEEAEEEDANSTDEKEDEEEEEEEEEEEVVKKKKSAEERSVKSGRKLRSAQAADESEEFWGDVLPQYLHLK